MFENQNLQTFIVQNNFSQSGFLSDIYDGKKYKEHLDFLSESLQFVFHLKYRWCVTLLKFHLFHMTYYYINQ